MLEPLQCHIHWGTVFFYQERRACVDIPKDPAVRGRDGEQSRVEARAHVRTTPLNISKEGGL